MKIKHWFIANKHNKFHPTALRPIGLIVFIAVFLAIPLIYNISTAHKLQVLGFAVDINIEGLNDATNRQRTANGLPALMLNSALNSAALAKANDMFANNYWAHISPTGVTPWSFILSAGYDYSSAGENLAKNFSYSSGVVQGWMDSESHRENLLSPTYTDVGYAIVNGQLLGEDTTLVVAMYGAQNSTPVASATASPAQPVTDTPKSIDQPVQPIAASTNSITPSTENTADLKPVESSKQASISSSSNNVIKSFAIINPLSLYSKLNWGQKASVLLVSTLLLLFVMKHTLIWRQQRRGIKHVWLRAHPLAQITVLVIALVATLVSGAGVIL